MYTGCCGNRNTIEQEAMLREKIIENIEQNFSYGASLLGKSNLEICRVYFNLPKYRLGMSKQ